MSQIITKIKPEARIKANITPPRSGAFEIKINEELVYSKFKTGSFPEESDIKNWF